VRPISSLDFEKSVDSPLPANVASNVANSTTAKPVSLVSLVMMVWTAGVTLLIVRYTCHWVEARALRKGCSPCDNANWQLQLSVCAEQLRVRCPGIAFHANGISPMVVGILRPLILLPKSADGWDPEQCRLILTHELSHIQRNDLLSEFLASIACAIYWFNPLAWMATHQLKKLREIACDDAVVTQTAQAAVYAEMLLDVALSHRKRSIAGAIAMARTNNVSDRIGCILDITRRRNGLTSRAAICLALFAIALSTIIGTGSLTSRAQDANPPKVEAEPAKTTDKENVVEQPPKEEPETQTADIKTMTVRVLDEDGNPLPDAKVHVGIWEFVKRNDYRNRNFKTDEKGEVSFPVPKRLQIIRYRARKPAYTPQFIGFETGTHDDGERVPTVYEFRLPKGQRLAGRVVDLEGQPIAGVKIEVDFESQKEYHGSDPKPSFMPLVADESPVLTDTNGRWEVLTAPSEELYSGEFRLKATHPQYAGDSEWSNLHKQQGVTTRQLRDGTAELKLSQGARLTGTIYDTKGNPVTNGMVMWTNDSSLDRFEKATEIDSAGHYETKRLTPGSYPITVVVPGLAPHQQQVELQSDLQQSDIHLSAGHLVKLRFVDSVGKPIPEVSVGVSKWRNSQAIYNWSHPEVINTHIPEKADKDGVYTWDWAPEDAVEYYVEANGFARLEPMLLPSPDVREIRLVSQTVAFGNVKDKSTGKPISKFRITDVWGGSTNFMKYRYVDDVNGNYRYTVDNSHYRGYQNRLRIEAEGYRTACGVKEFIIGSGPVQEDFELEPAAASIGYVQDQHGYPVTKFEVAVSTPTCRTSFEENHAVYGMHLKIEGEDHFSLPATFEPSLIRIYNESGFAQILCEADAPIPTIRLQPWSSLKGRLMQGDRPIGNETIYFWPDDAGQTGNISFRDEYRTITDASGEFHFDKLPPIPGYVRAYLGPWDDSQLTSSLSMPVQLQPGKPTEVNLGGGGVKLIGRVVATGRKNDEFNKQWSINHLIRRDAITESTKETASYGFDPSAPLDPYWADLRGFDWWRNKHQNHFVKLSNDGQINVYGVLPGKYELLIRLFDQPSGCLAETVGETVIPITISEHQVAAGSIDIGKIEIACRQGPRVGTDMRAFQFVDANGVSRYVDDMEGRYVVFHVWASWCGPCLESMPAIVGAQTSYPDNKVTFVGFNIDKDQQQARRTADSLNMRWAQNYLGEKSDLMRQLAISSVPAYYLIDPNGKLVASNESWSVIGELLKQQFSK
jgi:beta-lactamase regulating signal transducer with metallopeptidase domain/uncharacterized GH25 family protein/thiol-disulfide isomerase/thioredoxin